MKIEVTTPDDFVGNVINDMNSRRGRVFNVSSRATMQIVDGEVPLSEMFGYATSLRSLTQGRAAYTMQFERYMPTGHPVQESILKKIGRIY